MPKNKVKTVPICKEIFIRVINAKGYDLRRLGEEGICSEKTLHRMLDAGQIRPQYLDSIAKMLNVDPRYLSGQIQMGIEQIPAEDTPNGNTAHKKMEDFPYFRKTRDDQKNERLSRLIDAALLSFDINPAQYEQLDFDEQYEIVEKVTDALYKIFKAHFKKDGLGNKGLPAVYEIDYILMRMKDNHDEEEYAEDVLRPKYMKKPPKGMTVSQIRKMPAWKLVNLDDDEMLAQKPPDDENDLFSQKYKDWI